MRTVRRRVRGALGRDPEIVRGRRRDARWSLWLDAAESDPRDLLRPAPEDALEFIRVGTSVNSIRNNSPHLVERVPDPVQDALPF